MSNDHYELCCQLGAALESRNASLATAESCTGGGVARAITAVPGSSNWFGYGFVSYANDAKQRMLNVSAQIIEQHGAVSEAVVMQMATGALAHSGADYAIAISGIAGPNGGTEDKPVGTVWFAWAGPEGVSAQRHLLSGDRHAVREQAVEISLKQLLHHIAG